ncbi:MAG: hypothetical protein ACEPOZ_21225 [Marinifilaceae bacterium]
MSFLPFENIEIKTQLTASQIKERISECIEPKKIFRSGKKNTKPYEGIITGNRFKIQRIINYRNSFLPQIKGHIIQTTYGAKVEIKMRLNIAVYIFMTFWLGGIGSVFLFLLFSSIDDKEFNPLILAPLGMILFGYVLSTGGFKSESNRSRKDLEKILIEQ